MGRQNSTFSRSAKVRGRGNFPHQGLVPFHSSTNSGKGFLHEETLCSVRNGFCLAFLALQVAPVNAQTVPPLEDIKSQAELDKAVAALDAALFDSYNHCDLDKFTSFFVEDVEFYHNYGGLTLGRAALTESVKKNICGRVTRELVPGSLHVY